MALVVEKSTTEIAALEEHEQQALWEHVAELNLRRGLCELSERYRERLLQQGELDQSLEEVFAKLRLIREEIAAHDYPG